MNDIISLPSYTIVGLKKAQKVLVIDSNNIGWRAFCAPAYKHLTFKGTPSGHVFGFVSIVLSFINPKIPTAVVYAVDGYPREKYALYPGYKGGRGDRTNTGDPMPDITELTQLLPGYYLRDPDQEADDVIATFVSKLRRREAVSESGSCREVVVVSGDRDMLALADKAFIQSSSKEAPIGNSPDKIGERFGLSALSPKALPYFRATIGDPSDNIHPAASRIRTNALGRLLQNKCPNSIDEFVNLIERDNEHLSPRERRELADKSNVLRNNHKLIQLKEFLPIWPKRNTRDFAALHNFVVNRFGCTGLVSQLNRFK